MQVDGDPRVGTLLAGYRLEASLGRGGKGAVYLAEDVRLSRRVALKLLNPELTADERFRERFLRESQLAASLDHPSIVPVYKTGEAEGRLWVTMRYVEGTDLARLLAREGRLEPGRTLALVAQLADALDTARWSRGLMHGSLKPSGVLVAPGAGASAGERVVLLGFGLRRELPPGATPADVPQHVGTVDYLAPEQIEGRSVSPRSDVYGLGCILFQCLTGELPYERCAQDALLRALLREQPPSVTRYRRDLPAGIDSVIQRAMATRPEERYSTCAELAASARAALASGREQPGRASGGEPAATSPRLERAATERPPPGEATDAGSVGPPDSMAHRLWKSGRTSIPAIGLVVLLAALAGVLWLAGRGTGDVRPRPAGAPAPATPTAVVDEADETADPPATAEPPADPAGRGSPGPAGSREDSLVRIDATTGEILARVAIPFPKRLASDRRSVWLLTVGGRLLRIEPATNAVSRTLDHAGWALSGLAATGGSAWLGDEYGGVYRLAPGSSATEPVSLADPGGGSLSLVGDTLAAAAGSIWVATLPSGPCCEDSPDLYRVDPATERVLARLDDASAVVAAGAEFVWALRNDRRLQVPGLVRIDTETHATVPIGAVEFRWGGFTVARGAVWASSPEDGTIVRLDPVTGEEHERIRVGRAGALAAGAGAVWAAIGRKGTVVRYDIATGRTTTIDVGGTPIDLTVARGSVWVAVDEPAASAEPEPPAEEDARA